MKLRLAKRGGWNKIGVVASLVLCLAVGYALGAYQSQQSLIQCKAQSEMLTKDLTRAVARGVTIEADLIMCKEKK